ncbi:hypothetical protein GA0115240_144826 [Streptomyces sp. DvalAA-14]|nr:hypothetical protein GA0115240_144826 [Streptomyces sp. DvalAA-14]
MWGFVWKNIRSPSTLGHCVLTYSMLSLLSSTLRTLLFKKQLLPRLFRSWTPRNSLGSVPFSHR